MTNKNWNMISDLIDELTKKGYPTSGLYRAYEYRDIEDLENQINMLDMEYYLLNASEDGSDEITNIKEIITYQ